jgi:hydrogenase expression/formation protein HypE
MMNVVQAIHGTGGKTSNEFIKRRFATHLKSQLLSPNDAADIPHTPLCTLITTDAHVVDPIIFPGGNIGKLAISGVINDLVTRGGKPRFISMNFILEEGLLLSELDLVVESLAKVLSEHDIKLLCADTKVVPSKGKPGLMISSTLLGSPINHHFELQGAQEGDVIILSAPIGRHGLAILQARAQLPFQTQFESDCNSLYSMLEPLILENLKVNYMRDPTRGGLGGVLHELAEQFQLTVEIEEQKIPVQADVKAALSLLGIDPLEVANEGVMVLVVPAHEADKVLSKLKEHELGQSACVIGKFLPKTGFSVTVRTAVGGRRVLPWPESLNLPRIC